MPERWLERITMSTPRTNHAQKMEMNVQTHREKMTRVFATRSDSKPVRLFSRASARSARHCGAFKNLGRHACAPFLTQKWSFNLQTYELVLQIATIYTSTHYIISSSLFFFCFKCQFLETIHVSLRASNTGSRTVSCFCPPLMNLDADSFVHKMAPSLT